MDLVDNTRAALDALREVKAGILERVGSRWAGYAAGLAGGGALGESLEYRVEGDAVAVGSALHTAPYVELGTGALYTPAPEYVRTDPEWLRRYGPGGSENRGNARSGKARWVYFDEDAGAFRVGGPTAPRPFLAPAFEEHRDEYMAEIERGVRGME